MSDLTLPVLGFLEKSLVFVFSLGLMIFVHELGHFLVAKWCGVRVLTFSIGMGKKLIRFQRGETEYALSAIPFGGYVKMDGETPDDPGAGDGRDFGSKSLPARAAVAIAGPAMNVVLAFFIYAGLNFHFGVETPPPVGINEVRQGMPAELAGLRAGDVLLRLDGIEIDTPQQLSGIVRSTSEGSTVRIEVERDGEALMFDVEPAFDEQYGAPLIGVGTEPRFEAVVGVVKKGGPGEAAGIEVGDRVLRVHGQEVRLWREVQQLVDPFAEQSVEFAVRRGEREFLTSVVPETNRLIPARADGTRPPELGFYYAVPFREVGFGEALSVAATQTSNAGQLILVNLQQLVRGQVSREGVAGPIGIATYIAESYDYGMRILLQLIALISVNLAVVNLLPFPVLDGGQLVFLAIEGVARRPLSQRLMMVCNQIGIVVLLLIFLFFSLNDIDRILPISIFGGP